MQGVDIHVEIVNKNVIRKVECGFFLGFVNVNKTCVLFEERYIFCRKDRPSEILCNTMHRE